MVLAAPRLDPLPNRGIPRYIRKGECKRCGWCCLQEDPPCPHLRKEKDNTYTCMIFNDKEKRYKRCYLYPDAPPILHEGCGYYFLDTYENNKIVKRKL